MEKFAVLVGNDINNVGSGHSWSDLLISLTNHLSISVDFEQDKPFPLAYEEIYFKAVRKGIHTESDIKKFVAKHVENIKPSFIHDAIVGLNTSNIITTNYDLSLESTLTENINKLTNRGFITESKYNIFRNHKIDSKTIWHIHGSANTHLSITLGYEHYSGYLQQMRNYVVSGTKDTYKKKSFLPFTKVFKENKVENYSWIDLFFTKDIHILGLSLDFNETDLWWLLTFREKSKYTNGLCINNEIYYYIPSEYVSNAKSKIDMLNSVGVTIVPVNGHSISKSDYYQNVINEVAQKYA
ncbi:SIR2 family protein [Aeromonas veronii]|uniref:SIR2 family protein n=1 Tax=Aeromonas veronii TaxID=654 RepID=UPI003D211705